jgi:two-component system sensor histidine kinase BaeS
MRTLGLRLVLAFLAVSLAGSVVVALFARLITADRFGQFMSAQGQETMVAQLADYYRARGSWDGVEALLRGGMMGPGGMMGNMMGGGPVLADAQGRVIVAGGDYALGDALGPADLAAGVPITVDGRLAGTLLPGRGAVLMPMMSQSGQQFLAQVNQALVLAALGATALALILGIVFTRTFTQPLRELTAATRAVAAGEFGRQVPVRSRDEVGELAAAFNHMSFDLAYARDLRRQLTADIAHELRTPLSVILGHAEALQDGVLPPTPETFALLHDEASRLNRLVDDLRTLSLAETGQLALVRRPLAPGALLARAQALFAPRAQQQGVALELAVEPDLPEFAGDPDRLAQVLGNLTDNALRHTPAGGRVTLGARRAAHGLRLAVNDTGAGIAVEDLPHVFERFYRGDKARTREHGGSGLGLAIAKSLVEAHEGTLAVESTVGEGTTFTIDLPLGDSKSPA